MRPWHYIISLSTKNTFSQEIHTDVQFMIYENYLCIKRIPKIYNNFKREQNKKSKFGYQLFCEKRRFSHRYRRFTRNI